MHMARQKYLAGFDFRVIRDHRTARIIDSGPPGQSGTSYWAPELGSAAFRPTFITDCN